jgi:hypothetical protein
MKGLAGFAEQRVLQITLFSAGAAHEDRPYALSMVLREGGGTLRRFVVGVGVHGEQRQSFGHEPEAIGTLGDDAIDDW